MVEDGYASDQEAKAPNNLDNLEDRNYDLEQRAYIPKTPGNEQDLDSLRTPSQCGDEELPADGDEEGEGGGSGDESEGQRVDDDEGPPPADGCESDVGEDLEGEEGKMQPPA